MFKNLGYKIGVVGHENNDMSFSSTSECIVSVHANWLEPLVESFEEFISPLGMGQK